VGYADLFAYKTLSLVRKILTSAALEMKQKRAMAVIRLDGLDR
jgi:hypothetical protein